MHSCWVIVHSVQGNGLWQENSLFQDSADANDLLGVDVPEAPMGSRSNDAPEASSAAAPPHHDHHHLEGQLASLSSKHAEVIASKEELQRHLDQVREAHEQVQATLVQVQAEADERLRAAHDEAVRAEAEAGRRLQEAEGRVASFQAEASSLASDLEGLQRLHSETSAELCRWRDMASELESQIEKKSAELSAALQSAEQVSQEMSGDSFEAVTLYHDQSCEKLQFELFFQPA